MTTGERRIADRDHYRTQDRVILIVPELGPHSFMGIVSDPNPLPIEA